ncbi:MAG: AAC(3) family N-acetyltransferase [Halanaerobiaceae bacterium]|nr:AAC(3) family N-acetyltransferase [Halanaerobiaceae bacterium]
MYTKEDLLKQMAEIGIDPKGVLLIHSSMKAVGPVEGRADTVIDAFMEYMKDGLLIFPTHSWSSENLKDNIYDPRTEPSCVGILTNIFRQREGVVRSLHPSHSVAVIGKGAMEYIKLEEGKELYTPCPRDGCWSHLYDMEAQILFLGCSLTRNTFIHSIEEWFDVPDRINPNARRIKIINPYGEDYYTDLHGHHSSYGDVSQNYGKLLKPFLHKGFARKGRIGDAESYLCDAVGMADLTSQFLERDLNLFKDNEPVPEEWYL